MIVDFLGLEPLLIDRLASYVMLYGKPVDVVPYKNLPKLQSGSDRESVLRAPSLIVSYDGYKVLEASRNKARVQQYWSVAICVANVRDRARTGAREDAGPFIDQVIGALLGWYPQALADRQYKPLELTDPAYQPEYGERFSLFPLTFTTDRVVNGAPLQ